MRERVRSAFDTITRLDRLIPQVELPGTLQDALVNLDTVVTDIDGRVTSALTATTRAETARASVETVEQQATAAEAALTRASEVSTDVATRIGELQADVADTAEGIKGWVGIGTVGLTLILAWLVILHIALWTLGRRWRRGC
jgi:hypothetical protein